MLRRYLDILKNAGRIEESPRPLEDGLAAFEAGDHAAAARHLSGLAPDQQADPRVLTAMALIALGAGRFEDARELLLIARRQRPRDVRLAVALGECHAGLNDHLQAVTAFQAAARLDPAYPGLQRRLGASFAALGRAHDAMTALNAAVHADRTDADARFALAVLCVATGDDKRAAAQLHLLDRLAPHRMDVRRMRADIHFRAGDFRQMAHELEVLVAHGVADHGVFSRLADTYAMVGRAEDAQAMAARAAALAPAATAAPAWPVTAPAPAPAIPPRPRFSGRLSLA